MSHATTTAKITYRKTKAGQWVAFGPADRVRAGTIITVTKRSGETKQEHIDSVGRPFQVNGETMVYGYLAARTTTSTTSSRPARRNNWQLRTCEDCEFNQDAGDMQGCNRHRGNPRC